MDHLLRYYATLGIKTGSSLPEVKLAYRRLVKTWHPDLFPHDPLRQRQGERRMQEINAAYQHLMGELPALPASRPAGGLGNDAYGIGISEIDKQHEVFLKMFEKFRDTYASPSIIIVDKEVKMKIYLYILNLRRYVFKHFVTEEEYMIKYGYPDYFEHRGKHDEFLKKLMGLEEEYYNYDKLSPNSISEFISSWIADHIKMMDQEFGRYVDELKDI